MAKTSAVERNKKKRIPEEPTRDVLQFLINYAPIEKWKRDILTIVASRTRASEARRHVPERIVRPLPIRGWPTPTPLSS